MCHFYFIRYIHEYIHKTILESLVSIILQFDKPLKKVNIQRVTAQTRIINMHGLVQS